MKDDKRRKRHQQIVDSAYKVLRENGYAGASLLNIAKAAKASNETLYRWYGSKIRLFAEMVRDNAAETKLRLESAIQYETDPIEALKAIAPILLAMVLGERAILLNRAAAADQSNELGKAIAQNGREVIAPLISNLIARISPTSQQNTDDMTEIFIALLIGDLQTRRAIGAMGEPDESYVQKRVEIATNYLIEAQK